MNLMKHLTAVMITLALLAAMTSCTGGTNTPADTDTTTVGDGASTSRVETTETTAPVEEPFDVDAFLADATVYEVTTETATAPLNELDKMSDAEKPEKIALRFTDAEGLIVLMESGETVYGNQYYFVNRVINDTVNVLLTGDETIGYDLPDFSVEYNMGIAIVQTRNSSGRVLKGVIIKNKDYNVIKNNAPETGCTLSVYIASDGRIEYTKKNEKYAHNDFESFLMAYGSDDDFYSESGHIVFENSNIKLVSDEVKTIKDGHNWSDIVNRYCEHYELDSTGELVDLYKQYVAEGRQREFMELD